VVRAVETENSTVPGSSFNDNHFLGLSGELEFTASVGELKAVVLTSTDEEALGDIGVDNRANVEIQVAASAVVWFKFRLSAAYLTSFAVSAAATESNQDVVLTRRRGSAEAREENCNKLSIRHDIIFGRKGEVEKP